MNRDSLIPQIPDEYTEFLKSCFGLGTEDWVVDLGCGTGLLTLPLARHSEHVQGVDISTEKIAVARSQSTDLAVQWICEDAHRFEFGCQKYKLIIGFESMHLFLTKNLFRKIINGLLPEGFVAVGWVKHHWEDRLKDAIVDVMREVGFHWGEWDYYTFPQFPALAEAHSTELFPASTISLNIQQTAHVTQIANYLMSIDKTVGLTSDVKDALRHRLASRFESELGAQWHQGTSCYYCSYCQRRP